MKQASVFSPLQSLPQDREASDVLRGSSLHLRSGTALVTAFQGSDNPFANPPMAWCIEAFITQWPRPRVPSYPLPLCFHQHQRTGLHFNLLSQTLKWAEGKWPWTAPVYHHEDFLNELSWPVQSLLNPPLPKKAANRESLLRQSWGKKMLGLDMVSG